MKKNFFQENKNFFYYIGALVLLFLVILALQPLLYQLVQGNPEWKETYEFIRVQLDKGSMLWLFIVAVAGSLFFISIPVDIFFTYYIIIGADPFLSLLICFAGSMIGRAFDFWVGYAFSGYVTENIIHKDYKSFSKRSKKWGSLLMFLSNIPFFPMEPFIMFMGTLKYPFWKFFVYNGLGKIVKLVIIIVLFKYAFAYQSVFLQIDPFDATREMIAYFFTLL